MRFENPFKKLPQKPPQESPEKKFVDPAADGWKKTQDGFWVRRTNTGVEYLGNISPRKTLTPEQVQAHYNRKKELERRVQEGNEEAAKELESVRKSIEYLERYGPAVMGGEQ